MKSIQIGDQIINRGFGRPYIIAEAGVNHEGDIEKARLMISQAARAGANAIKFQTYKAETLASRYSPSYWDTSKESTTSQFELFKKYDVFGEKEYKELAQWSREEGITFLSTPFDFDSIDFLEPLVPAYKIASADINNTPFLKHIARKGKPIILSTGASTMSEIWKAVELFEKEGNEQIVLLHCVLNYPTPIEKANLKMISDMINKFPNYTIGYSDHTPCRYMEDILTTAWLLGAQVIEKHFTFDKSLPGNDHYHAMDEKDLERLIAKFGLLEQAIGESEKHFLPEEEVSRINARRSLVAVRVLKRGQVIEQQDVAIKRPGTGVPPEFLDIVVGSRALRNINEDEPIGIYDFGTLNDDALNDK